MKYVIVTPRKELTFDDESKHLVGTNYKVTEFFYMLFEDFYIKVQDYENTNTLPPGNNGGSTRMEGR